MATDDICDQRSGKCGAEAEAEAVQDAGGNDSFDGIKDGIADGSYDTAKQSRIETFLFAEGPHARIRKQADEDSGIAEDACDKTDLAARGAETRYIDRQGRQQEMKACKQQPICQYQ